MKKICTLVLATAFALTAMPLVHAQDTANDAKLKPAKTTETAKKKKDKSHKKSSKKDKRKKIHKAKKDDLKNEAAYDMN